MRGTIAAALFGGLLCLGCDRKPEDPKPAPSNDPAAGSGAAAGQPGPGAVRGEEPAASWKGVVEKAGPSIEMQGSHRLVADGKTVALLQSTKVDLTKFEGKTVSVTGTATVTVEGGKTLIDVQTVTVVP